MKLTSHNSRILAFSLSQIEFVKVRVNGKKWIECDHMDGPLYVLKWNPKKYLYGLHTIDVYVRDSNGREYLNSQPFIMDDTRLSFDLLSRIALMTDASTVVSMTFVNYIETC